MSNTASILKSITDRGLFENVAMAVLRATDSDYKQAIQTGINAAGETVASPVDAFSRISKKDKNTYILFAHTTTEKRNLRSKWNDDILKATSEANDIIQADPYAEVRIVLTTNQTVDLSLLKEFYTKSNVWDIWDVLRFAHFLDNEPEGQWIRQRFLGIDSTRLSAPLAFDLCRKSIDEYAQTVTVGEVATTVPRRLDDDLYNLSATNSSACIFLEGDAGSGKTTSLVRVMERWVMEGKFCIRISGETLDKSATVEAAVSSELSLLQSTFDNQFGMDFLAFAKDPGKLLIVVDDINRTARQDANVKKLFYWARSSSFISQVQDKGARVRYPAFVIVCPVWPSNLYDISLELRGCQWARIEHCPLLSDQEASQAVQKVYNVAGKDITSHMALQIGTDLGRDPFLIGILGNMLSGNPELPIAYEANHLVSDYIQSRLSIIAASDESATHGSDYDEALIELVAAMLHRRKLQPAWRTVREWSEISELNKQLVGHLLKGSELARINKANELVFRHDRIFESISTQAINKIIDASRSRPDVIEEPYYSRLIGVAIAHRVPSQAILTAIVYQQPVGVAEALRASATSQPENAAPIAAALKTWLQAESDNIPEVGWRVQQIIADIDYPGVIDLVSVLPATWSIMLARLRNGLASGGAQFCTLHYFLPEMSSPADFSAALNAAMTNHLDSMLRQVDTALRSPTISDQERCGWLAMAGFIGNPRLLQAISTCWNQSAAKDSVLVSAVWAAFRCAAEQPEQVSALISYWNAMPEPSDKSGLAPKHYMASTLQHAFRHGIPDGVIDYVAQVRHDYPTIAWRLVNIFDAVNSPPALRLVVDEAAQSIASSRASSGYAMWARELGQKWRDSFYGRDQLKENSRQALFGIWTDENATPDARVVAFDVWKSAYESHDLSVVQRIGDDSPLHRSALQLRAEIGDVSVVGEYVKLLEDNTHLFWWSDKIWCAEVESVFESWLVKDGEKLTAAANNRGSDNLTRFLMYIPVQDAVRLLSKHWEALQHGYLYVQAAVVLGTDSGRQLVDQALATWSGNDDVWTHFSFHLESALNRTGVSARGVLDNLIPFLNLIPTDEINHIARSLRIFKSVLWGRQHLSLLASDHIAQRHYPDEAGIRRVLDLLVMDDHGEMRVEYELEEWGADEGLLDWIYNISARWLIDNTSAKAVKVFGPIALATGDRRSLEVLSVLNICDSYISQAIEGLRFSVRRRVLV